MEARRASIPPRPTTPPRPSTPPHTADPADDVTVGPAAPEDRTARTAPAGSAVTGGATPHGTPANSPSPGGTPPPPAARPADGAPVPPRPAHRPPQPGHPGPGRTSAQDTAPVTPPPPAATARFPDGPPPATDDAHRSAAGTAGPAPAPGRGHGSEPVPRPVPLPAGEPTVRPGSFPADEPTARLTPLSADRPAGDGWAPPAAPAPSRRTAEALGRVLGPRPGGRPYVTLAQPDIHHRETRRDGAGRRPGRARVVTATACVVLGLGLIGGAAAGSWLAGDADAAGDRGGFAAAGELWHSAPVDELFPPTVEGEGAGPGGADRTWTRIAVAPDSGCADAFDPLLRKALGPVGCARLLRATYTDSTHSYVTTVGLLFTKADSAAMTALKTQFRTEGLDRRTDLMPRPYAARNTVAAGFGDDQRASWALSVLTDAPVVVYAVSGFADGRTVTEPQPAEEAMKPDATTAPAQSGLGHEARGLADRVERGLRRTVSADGQSS
ncbi:hypothetical protein [Streptomyces poonensis]|uniref:Uncharacterized protein n=1 Tax=Streptomyces poonensis TaxID=68255 RepID=A0A918PGE8_9ACTN|nr:hypothetical protein [Streptomyces poonensis]GGZ07712.1 hypothetical protein GCM10010365_28550 [Streptomyces poonensis]